MSCIVHAIGALCRYMIVADFYSTNNRISMKRTPGVQVKAPMVRATLLSRLTLEISLDQIHHNSVTQSFCKSAVQAKELVALLMC